MATITRDLEEVLKNYKKKLSTEEESMFKSTTLKDLKDSIIKLQKDQNETKSLRNLNKIQPFLQAMSQYQSIIEVFLNTSDILCFVWGPLKFLLLIARNMSVAFDVILDTYKQVSENFPLLEKYRSLFKENENMQQILVWIYEDLLKFHLQAWRVMSRPTWKKMFNAAWHDFQESIKPILSNMNRHRELIERSASLQHIEDSRTSILDLIQRSRDERTLVQDSFDAIKRGIDEGNFLRVTYWLSAADSSEDQEHFASQKEGISGSGSWILQHPKVLEFLDHRQCTLPIFWIHGIPGAGKTVLTSVIIDQALKLAVTHSLSVVYCYCRDLDVKRNTFPAVTRAILAQLLQQSKEKLLPYLYEECLHPEKGKLTKVTLTSPKRCADILNTILDEVTKTIIVIDGLDECEPAERKAILNFFATAIERNEVVDPTKPWKLRGLFVSQDLNDIKVALHHPESLRLNEDHTKADINNYVLKRAVDIQQKHQDMSSAAKDSIVKLVRENSDGMFLFAKLVLDNLFEQNTLEDVYKELGPIIFPDGLNEAYGRISNRIFHHQSPTKQVIARRILGWVTCTKRPLSWREIQAASSIDTSQKTVNFPGRQLTEDIRHICGSLVEILPGDRLQLVHATAKYYLLHSKHIDEQKEERSLALLCLSYLNFDYFEATVSEDLFKKFLMDGSYAFIDYSCLHWSDHLESATKSLKNVDLNFPMPFAKEIDEFFMSNDTGSIPDNKIYEEIAKKCESLTDSDCYKAIVTLISNTRVARGTNDRMEALGELGATVVRIRKMLQNLSNSPELSASDKTTLKQYYGKNWFHCDRHACHYFHEGFPSLSLLEQHTNRHDKPYCCTVLGCTRMYIGWPTEKDLKKHMSQTHPDPESLSLKFPHVKKLPTVFQCEQCPRNYNRASSLKVHVQREHLNQRDFVCGVCKKDFVRKYELDRHEKSAHNTGTAGNFQSSDIGNNGEERLGTSLIT